MIRSLKSAAQLKDKITEGLSQAAPFVAAEFCKRLLIVLSFVSTKPARYGLRLSLDLAPF